MFDYEFGFICVVKKCISDVRGWYILIFEIKWFSIELLEFWLWIIDEKFGIFV